LVFHIKGITQGECVREWDAEEDMSANMEEVRGGWRKLQEKGLRGF